MPLFFCACSKKELPKKPIVFVTIAPYAYAVEKIAGNTLQIETLIPQGMNIHVYEPSPKIIETQSQAIAWFRIDEPFEKKIVLFLRERNPKQIIINLQEDLDLLSYQNEWDICTDHSHSSYDLHTWLSPKIFLIQSERIAKVLMELFPEHQEFYQKNFHQFSIELKNLEREIKEELSPLKGEAILTSHPAFGYFCTDFGLIQLSIECEGKDPRPRDIEKILKKIKTQTIRCVLLQQGYNNQGALIIGEKLQLPIYQVNPYAKNYSSNLKHIAKDIAK